MRSFFDKRVRTNDPNFRIGLVVVWLREARTPQSKTGARTVAGNLLWREIEEIPNVGHGMSVSRVRQHRIHERLFAQRHSAATAT